MKKFSVVVPIYNNVPNIPYTIPRLLDLSKLLPKYDIEYIFVDDGSRDNSFKELISEREKNSKIKVIKLSKNFGSMIAIQAGLDNSSGDCVGIITADLQDPPELFEKMIDHWEKGKKVIIATRQVREDSFFNVLFANFFHFVMSKFALPGWPKGGFDFVLLDRQVVNELSNIKEKNRHTLNLIYWLGFDRVMIPYVRQKRKHGKSQWTFSKKVKLFIDAFISFSYVPIRFISFVGILTALLSFIYGTFVFFSYLLGDVPVKGYTPIILVITFLLGLIMVMLGIIGEYMWRTLDETRSRPLYVVDEILM